MNNNDTDDTTSNDNNNDNDNNHSATTTNNNNNDNNNDSNNANIHYNKGAHPRPRRARRAVRLRPLLAELRAGPGGDSIKSR